MMRNILMTVMMLIVVVVMFTGIIMSPGTGTKSMIENKGNSINSQIGELIDP